MDTDDKSVAYVDEVPQDLQECAKKAAEECPVQAIQITE
jgi:ferredoxin